MLSFIKKIVGSKNDREIKRLRPYVDEINKFEDEFKSLTDDQLRAKTEQFKQRIVEATAPLQKELADLLEEAATADGERREEIKTESDELDKQIREVEAEILQELLPEAFAAVREASRRTIGLRHFDVQMIGGAVLHEGKIAEMKTGD